MTPKQYCKQALKTLSAPVFVNGDPKLSAIVHACMGLQTESAELTDALKKHIIYGRELDQTNLIEEAGDVLWYLALMFDALGTDFSTAFEANIAKLRARYGVKFTTKKALERNTNKEIKVMEKTQAKCSRCGRWGHTPTKCPGTFSNFLEIK